jgi:hypothetical protein
MRQKKTKQTRGEKNYKMKKQIKNQNRYKIVIRILNRCVGCCYAILLFLRFLVTKSQGVTEIPEKVA